MKNYQILGSAIVGLSMLFSSCEKDEVANDSVINETIITVPVNPLTGEPEVTNYTPLSNTEIAVPTTKAIGNQIVDDQEIRLGTEPNFTLEVDGVLPADYVLTGVGARAKGGSITTLVLEGRKLRNNGTLGARKQFKFGTEPNHSLEVWYAVPNNHVITGIGARLANGNITTMKLRYRKINYNNNNRFRLGNKLKIAKVGTEPNHTLEAEFVAKQHGLNLKRVLLTRIAMREKNSNLTTLRVFASTLK